METTPAMDAALAADRCIWFVAAKADLPGGVTVRILDAAGEVTWSEGTFTGVDPLFGTINNIENISDGVGDQAPQLNISFLPADDADAAALTNPAYQGSRLRLWLGALNVSTKAVVLDPLLMFDGEIDQPRLEIDASQRGVDMDCVSSFEKLFTDDEGIRLSPANHKEVWPGETGLDDITGIVKQVIWGPGSKLTSASPSSSGIGGGGDSSGRLDPRGFLALMTSTNI